MNSPIKNYNQKKYPAGNITQWFAENPDIYRKWGLAYHNGLDVVAPHGEPLLAVESGTIVEVNNNPEGYGKHVRLMSKKQKDGTYRVWVYGHCSEIRVSVGQKVKAGDHIADMGNTGFVISGATPFWKHNPYAGTHLHLGVRIVKEYANGWRYPGSPLKIKVLNYDNGVKGAIDPAPFFFTKEDEETKRQQLLTIVSLLNTLVSLLQRKKTGDNQKS